MHCTSHSVPFHSQADSAMPTVDRGMLLQFKRSLVLLKCAHACEHFFCSGLQAEMFISRNNRISQNSQKSLAFGHQPMYLGVTAARYFFNCLSTLESFCLAEKGRNIFSLAYVCQMFRVHPFNQQIKLLRKTKDDAIVQGTSHALVLFVIQPLRVSLLDA